MPGPASVPAVARAMRRVALVGVRGSREPEVGPAGGMGPTIARVADRIEASLRAAGSGLAVERIGLAYPAASFRYARSRDRGVQELASVLRRLSDDEPPPRLALLGLSQGADVIRTALGSGLLAPETTDRVEAVVLLGDPGRDPRRDEPFLHGSTRATPGVLAGTAVPMPRAMWPRTWSYCLAGDRVAGGGAGRLGALCSGTHTHYVRDRDDVLARASAFVATLLLGAEGAE